jgi:hypothetical protein
MPFEKGTSGNPQGKPAGTKNKNSVQIRSMIEQFIIENFHVIVDDFNKLPEKERYKVLCNLLQYTIPKPQAEIGFERLTDDQLNEIIEKLKVA